MDQVLPICKCGRPIGEKPHCPRCGSNYNYSKVSLNRIVKIDGQEYTVRAFHCRGCGRPFDEAMECKAPKTKEALAQAERPNYSQSGKSQNMDPSFRSEYEMNYINETLKSLNKGEQPYTRKLHQKFQTRFGIDLNDYITKPFEEEPDPFDAEGPAAVHEAGDV